MRGRLFTLEQLLWDLPLAAGNQLLWAEAVANGQAVRAPHRERAGQAAIFEALAQFRASKSGGTNKSEQ